jgi:hypothetical protein
MPFLPFQLKDTLSTMVQSQGQNLTPTPNVSAMLVDLFSRHFAVIELKSVAKSSSVSHDGSLIH